MDILFTIIGIAILWIGEYIDYSSTMKLHNAGYLNYKFDAFGRVVSKEKNNFFMKRGVFQVNKFKLAKLLLAVVPSIVAILVLILADDKLYALAPFVFNLIVGIVHWNYGAGNNRNYRLIKKSLDETR